MWWFPLISKKDFHTHTLVLHQDIGIEYKKVPSQNTAGYDVFEYSYHQSICIECGEKFNYELINKKYLHTINYNGTVIKKE